MCRIGGFVQTRQCALGRCQRSQEDLNDKKRPTHLEIRRVGEILHHHVGGEHAHSAAIEVQRHFLSALRTCIQHRQNEHEAEVVDMNAENPLSTHVAPGGWFLHLPPHNDDHLNQTKQKPLGDETRTPDRTCEWSLQCLVRYSSVSR